MGKGTITFRDTDDGEVRVSIKFDPPVSDHSATPAQLSLMEKWERLCQMADAEDEKAVDQKMQMHTQWNSEWIDRGEQIKRHRLAMDFSLRDSSHLLGISVGDLTKMEAGVIEPDMTILERLM